MSIPIDHQAYELMHEGTIALSQVESHGMPLNMEYLDWALESTREEIQKTEDALRNDKIWPHWRKRFGDKANLYSHAQLGELLWNVLKVPYPEVDVEEEDDEEGQSTQGAVLEKLDLPFVKNFIKLGQLDKCHGTYLKRLKKSAVNGRFHPSFFLHKVRTYRSSSDLQNIPVRNPYIAKMIRRGFVADPGCVIVENDFKGLEVSIAACYHKDPVMLSYLSDPSKDMHRDMAMQLYKLKQKQTHKNARYCAKNKFVFPEFYGSYFAQCAPDLWEWAERLKVPGPEGYTLMEWLKHEFPAGLGACNKDRRPEEGTFEHHVMEVEKDFWGNRFKVYDQWKKEWYNQYLEEGGFSTLTGFRINGQYRRNQVINYPVQGSAFHCLLWTLIQLNKLLRKYKMKSRVMTQIHDSMVGNVRVEELTDYLQLVKHIVEELLPKHWKWIIAPLEIENEICPPGCSWFYKDGFQFKDGVYTATDKKTDKKETFTNHIEFLDFVKLQLKPNKAA
jgi:DNA polymerase I-like protein with 3'-5' exonuclease and polymerase domains